MGHKKGQLLENRSSVGVKAKQQEGHEYKPSAPGILDSSDNYKDMDPAWCSWLHKKVYGNDNLDPDHYLVHRAQWLCNALKGGNMEKDGLGDLVLWYLDAFGLRAPHKKQFQEKVCEEGLEGVQPLSDTELPNKFICQVCKHSGCPLWGVDQAPDYKHTRHFEVLEAIKETVQKEVKDFVLVDWLCKTLKAGNRNLFYLVTLECLHGFGLFVEDMIHFDKGVQSGLIPKSLSTIGKHEFIRNGVEKAKKHCAIPKKKEGEPVDKSPDSKSSGSSLDPVQKI